MFILYGSLSLRQSGLRRGRGLGRGVFYRIPLTPTSCGGFEARYAEKYDFRLAPLRGIPHPGGDFPLPALITPRLTLFFNLGPGVAQAHAAVKHAAAFGAVRVHAEVTQALELHPGPGRQGGQIGLKIRLADNERILVDIVGKGTAFSSGDLEP